MNGKRIGTGFVAAHVWRKLSDGSEAPRNAKTYSFLPNLVWLPVQLAKLSDREGGFVQTLLQAISLRIYRAVRLTPRLAAIVDPIWDELPVRSKPPELEALNVSAVNFFRFDEKWLGRRCRTLDLVRGALASMGSTQATDGKIVARRYGSGLRELRPTSVARLLHQLTEYEAAVAEAGAAALVDGQVP
jgi:hypothetical protein